MNNLISKRINPTFKNKELLNDKINSNENVLINTELRKKDLTNGFSEVTINTIRKAKYKELKQILENIKRNDYFKFDYDETDIKNKRYTR